MSDTAPSRWSGNLADIRSVPKEAAALLEGDSFDYHSINCTKCPFQSRCAFFSSTNPGCGMRKAIYDKKFAKIEFTSEDPLATNRLSLISKYFVELSIKRHFGVPLDAVESQFFKNLMFELGKLAIDKRGELVDSKSKKSVPWEEDAEVAKMRKDFEENQQLRQEVAQLREKVKKKDEKKEEKKEES